MENYYCGLHAVVGMADSSKDSLKNHETLNNIKVGAANESGSWESSEPSAFRFMKNVAKYLGPKHQDKYGAHTDFTIHCANSGKIIVMIDLDGKRFNIHFKLAEIVYYLLPEIKSFVELTADITSGYPKYIYADVCDPWVTSGVRAIGLTGKLISSPLLRVIENREIGVSEIGTYYSSVISFMESCVNSDDDMSRVIKGGYIVPCLEQYMHKDAIWASLISSAADSSTITNLKTIFNGLIITLKRLVADHIENGIYSNMTEEQKSKSASVVTHNKLPEEIFGHLDRGVKSRPNATPLLHEAQIVTSKNRTVQWLKKQSGDKKHRLMQRGRAHAKTLKSN